MDKNYLLKGELFRDIKLSIYEIVTNCIKHSNGDKLSLKFVAKNKTLRIQISDNGFCQIAELELNNGNGIRNIKKRIARNNGQVTFYTLEETHGLTIQIQLPLR
jgi:signal transduction histidine kinase